MQAQSFDFYALKTQSKMFIEFILSHNLWKIETKKYCIQLKYFQHIYIFLFYCYSYSQKIS